MSKTQSNMLGLNQLLLYLSVLHENHNILHVDASDRLKVIMGLVNLCGSSPVLMGL
jgi:hypothetical protein